MSTLTTLLLLAGTLVGCGSVPTPSHQVMKPLTGPPTEAPPAPSAAKREEQPNERYALLVGVDGYQGDLPPLKFAAQDMRALAWALTTYGGYKRENVQLLVDTGEGDGQPNKTEILDGLKEWTTKAKLGADDTVFFAFSGHGFTDGEQAYLMPLGSDTESLRETALPVDDIHELLATTAAGQQFLVVDACRSGITRSSANTGRVSRSQLARGGSSICQLFSCDDGEVSIEDGSLESMLPGEKGHGIFTHYLVRGLAGAANAQNDQLITIDEVLEYTSARVEEYVTEKNKTKKSKLKQTVNLVSKKSGKVVLAEYRVPPAQELTSMPGLGGRWWFDEVPWLLPHLRDQLPTYVDELNGGDDNDRKFLRGIKVLDVYGQLRTGFDKYEKVQPSEMRSALQQIIAADAAVTVTDSPATADKIPLRNLNEMIELARDNKGGAAKHTLAVLHHWRYSQGAVESEPLARAQYKAALEGYAILHDQRGLHARCLADFGLLYSATGEYLLAAQRFVEAREIIGQDEATMLHIECLAQEGDARRKLRKFDVARKCYEEAYKLCGNMTESGNAHPLAIAAMKQRGWCFMDEWQVNGARDAFQQARDRSQDHRKLNPASEEVVERWVIEFHIEHGLAMCDRYGGNLKAATENYVALVDKVEDKYNEWQPNDPHVDDLKSRLANSYERLGDCYLQGQDAGAVSSFRSARDYYKELAGNLELQLQTHCKLAIAQMVTQTNVKGAEATLHELDSLRLIKITKEDDEAKRKEFERIFTKIATYENVARAIVEAATDDKFDRLKAIVAKPANRHDVRDDLDRDQIDLYLVAARELIQRLPGDDPALASVVAQLYGMIPTRQGADRLESLAYRREYYDVGLIAWMKQPDTGDLDSLIDHVVQAKTNRKYGQKPGKNILVFYFPKNGKQQGYCVWHPSAGAGSIFPLGTSWEKLRGQKVDLPTDVLKAVRDANGDIEVQWSDRVLEPLGLESIHDLPYVIPEDIAYHFRGP